MRSTSLSLLLCLVLSLLASLTATYAWHALGAIHAGTEEAAADHAVSTPAGASANATHDVDPAPRELSPTAPDFTYGIFEDANHVGGPTHFAAMVADLKKRQFDSVLFTNNFTYRDAPLLSIADDLGFRVVFSHHAELNHALWPADAPDTIEHARQIIFPLVDHVRHHRSLMGYNVMDDAPDRLASKVALAVQAFRERDPHRPAAPTLVERHDEVALAARPDILLTYVYPALTVSPPCDFTRREGRVTVDWLVNRLRHVASLGEGEVPVWVVLQTHGGSRDVDPASPDDTALREPTREEVRLQHWLAVGEGVKGVFWFTYSTQQFWTGLRDNPPLLTEVSDLARRTIPLRPVLGDLRKVPDRARALAEAELPVPYQPYASTLIDKLGTIYVVVVNRSCDRQHLRLSVPDTEGWLRNVETGAWHALGAVLPFDGGDGRLFELVVVDTGEPGDA